MFFSNKIFDEAPRYRSNFNTWFQYEKNVENLGNFAMRKFSYEAGYITTRKKWSL